MMVDICSHLRSPVGTYIEYKYTLGDGLWSSEVTSTGAARLRQMLVPTTDLEQNEVVDAWLAPDTQALHFEVKVPPDTPKDEGVSIQFNPGFGWIEPLPMSAVPNPGGSTLWNFDLTGPFNKVANLQYRYCRQEQCGAADDEATTGTNPTGRVVNPSANPGKVNDEVSSWAC